MEDGWLRPMDLFGLPSSILIHMERVFCSCCCFGWLFLVYLFVCSNLIFFFQQRSYFLSSFDFKLKLIIQQKETYLLTRELLFQGECLVCGACSSALFWRCRSISMDELTSLH